VNVPAPGVANTIPVPGVTAAMVNVLVKIAATPEISLRGGLCQTLS